MFYLTFVELCAKIKKSPSAVAEEMGYARSVVTRWSKGTVPRLSTMQRVADYFGVPVDIFLEENKKSPASVSESGRPYVDLATKMIWSPAPVSILAAQYDVPSPVLAEIVGCDTDRASFMIFGTEAPNDEELLRIAAAFCVTPDSLRKGWVPLTASQYVADDIARRKKERSL